MIRSILKTASIFALVAGFAVLGSATTASAVVVQYMTTGSFGPAGGGAPLPYPGTDPASVTIGTTTITFIGVPLIGNNGLIDTPTNASLGQFVTSGGSSVDQSLNGTQFNLYVTQVSPAGSNVGTFDSVLNGTVRFLNSQAYVDFATVSQTINSPGLAVTYNIINAARNFNGSPVIGSLALNRPGITGQPSAPASIEAFITSRVTAVPEPTTMASALMGLAVLAGVGRMRRKTA